MKGTIRTFAQEKQYGFIGGDDGKDYFFHLDDFVSQNDRCSVCDDMRVEFEQHASPKGYRARRCSRIDQETTTSSLYVEPDTFLTSKLSSIPGWETIEVGDWLVHGASRESPDAARADLIQAALSVRANALIDVEYSKKRGEEPGTGNGIHYYTIHNFTGRIARVGKRSARGTVRKEDLYGLNECAEQKFQSMLATERMWEEEERQSTKRKIIGWAIATFAVYFVSAGASMIPAVVLLFQVSQLKNGSSVIANRYLVRSVVSE